MPSPQLYHSRTGNSLRASIALELSGIKAERNFLNLKEQEHKTEQFLRINPAGTVPVYVEYDENEKPLILLTQSGAILEFLLSKYRPELVPEDLIVKAQTRSVILAALSDIAVQNGLIGYMSFHAENVAFLKQRLINSLKAAFLPIKDQPYFGGEHPNIADFAHFPVVYMRAEMIANTDDFDHIVSWLDRMQSIPAVEKAVDNAGLQVPC